MNRNTYRIKIKKKKKIAIHIVSAPKYRDNIESGGRCIVPSLVHTIAEKHNHYLAVRCPHSQRHRSLNKAISADATFSEEALCKFELAPHDYTTLCTRSSKDIGASGVQKTWWHSFLCKYNGQYIASPKMIKVTYIYCAISRYIDYCDRPTYHLLLLYEDPLKPLPMENQVVY